MILTPQCGMVYRLKGATEWLQDGFKHKTSLIYPEAGSLVLVTDIDIPEGLVEDQIRVTVLLPTNELVYIAGDDHFWYTILEPLSDTTDE